MAPRVALGVGAGNGAPVTFQAMETVSSVVSAKNHPGVPGATGLYHLYIARGDNTTRGRVDVLPPLLEVWTCGEVIRGAACRRHRNLSPTHEAEG